MEEKRVKQHHLPRSIKRILFLLCTHFYLLLPISVGICTKIVSMSKIKDVEISSWIIPLPFQNVAIKTHARSFCATLQPAQPLKSDWNPGTTTPMIRLPLKLDWKPSFKLWKQMQHMLNLNHNVPQIISLLVSSTQWWNAANSVFFLELREEQHLKTKLKPPQTSIKRGNDNVEASYTHRKAATHYYAFSCCTWLKKGSKSNTSCEVLFLQKPNEWLANFIALGNPSFLEILF